MKSTKKHSMKYQAITRLIQILARRMVRAEEVTLR